MQKRKEINQRRVPAQSGNFDKKKMHQSHVSVLFGRSVDCNNFLARSSNFLKSFQSGVVLVENYNLYTK